MHRGCERGFCALFQRERRESDEKRKRLAGECQDANNGEADGRQGGPSKVGRREGQVLDLSVVAAWSRSE